MTAYQCIGLLLFVLATAVFLVRFVHSSVDGEFRNLARAVSDEAYRGGELKRLDAMLAATLPLPGDVRPVGKPAGGLAPLPPVLLAMGAILVWGGVFAREERSVWLYGGMFLLLLSAGIMLATLRRRKRERLSRLLRFRADLRRMDGNHAGAAADLRELLKLTPWDDAAWAELSDDLSLTGALADGLDAIRQAARLDPRYGEYRMLEASLAIRLGRADVAREAVKTWTDLDGLAPDDNRLAAYRAAIYLAEGNRDQAAATIKEILLDDEDATREFLDTDQALAGVRDFLPGPAPEEDGDAR